MAQTQSIAADRLAALSWPSLEASLDERGYAVTPRLLDAGECRDLRALYADEGAFRSRIVMRRHRFGEGEYKYFRYPLPDIVEELRRGFLSRPRAARQSLAPGAGRGGALSADTGRLLEHCHEAGQARPTPLLLKYGDGDYNCLHQDLYGGEVSRCS